MARAEITKGGKVKICGTMSLRGRWKEYDLSKTPDKLKLVPSSAGATEVNQVFYKFSNSQKTMSGIPAVDQVIIGKNIMGKHVLWVVRFGTILEARDLPCE